MATLPTHVQESINLDPRNKQRGWIEDVEIRVKGTKPLFFSLDVSHELWPDGSVRVTTIHNLLELEHALFDFAEQVLEDEK